MAVEVFEGNTGDPKTLASQVGKLRERFGLERVVLVGDRGMITDARIREDLCKAEGLDWITSLRSPADRSSRRVWVAAAVALRPEGPGRDHVDPDYPR